MSQKTLVFLKPDTFENKIVGEVIAEFEKKFNIVSMKMVKLTKEDAKQFYAVHKEKPFYEDLATYASRGPVVALLLEGEKDFIPQVRKFMGATNPPEADKDTIRGKFGSSLDANVVHGSDSPESAAVEIPFFFPEEVSA
ncbi:MAG: Nucleoside diphosphate kinase [Chlamydiae bacterium]|nr:Nucleoside diphosphate kinase [Chlamydiota bacterium]